MVIFHCYVSSPEGISSFDPFLKPPMDLLGDLLAGLCPKWRHDLQLWFLVWSCCYPMFIHMGGSINGESPKKVGLFHGKIRFKWFQMDDDWGIPISGNLHMYHMYQLYPNPPWKPWENLGIVTLWPFHHVPSKSKTPSPAPWVPSCGRNEGASPAQPVDRLTLAGSPFKMVVSQKKRRSLHKSQQIGTWIKTLKDIERYWKIQIVIEVFCLSWLVYPPS